MKYVKIYDPDTKKENTIPLSEVSPNFVPVNRVGKGIFWMDPTKLKRNFKPIHRPFSSQKRETLQAILDVLFEFRPCSLEEFEFEFRCDQHPEREIRHWRWIAFEYKRLTNSQAFSPARRHDVYQLCLRWTFSKNIQEVLEFTPLKELAREEAGKLMQGFDPISAEFFGGDFKQSQPNGSAWDYSAIRAVDEFRAKAASADVIFAVDWDTGEVSTVYGTERLRAIVAMQRPVMLAMAYFAVDFSTRELEHLCAAIKVTKGSYDWGGKTFR